jgi:hypothetical protein
MSGIRAYNFREGDRSEYLANYLLSGLGLVTAVSRQEDIGFDFYCQLADQEIGNLSFGYPFIIQVKSYGVDNISYGETDPNKWKAENLNWLFRLEIPLLIGVVCKKRMRLDIYNTSPLHFLFFENPNPSIIELKLRYESDSKNIDRPNKQSIDNWQSGKGDGNKYLVDLGNPIVTIGNEDLHDHEKLKNKKDMLKNIVALEQENYLFRKLKVPFFRWIFNVKTNGDIQPTWAHLVPQNYNLADLYSSSLAQSIISIAINLKSRGKAQEALALKPLLKKIHPTVLPIGIKENFPDLFN